MTANVMMQACGDGAAGAFWVSQGLVDYPQDRGTAAAVPPRISPRYVVHCRVLPEVTADQRTLENGARQESIWRVMTSIYPVVDEDPKFLS